MNKRSVFPAVIFGMLSLFTAAATKAQCTALSFSSLKSVWDSKAKDDKVLELGFEKRSTHFARCKMVMCTVADSVGKNFNEFIFIYDDEVMYSFSDKSAYMKLIAEIKRKAKYAGFSMFDEIKREYYFDGTTCYYFYVGLRSCLSTEITDYNIGIRDQVPSFVE